MRNIVMSKKQSLSLHRLAVPQPSVDDIAKTNATYHKTDSVPASNCGSTLCKYAVAHDAYVFKTIDENCDSSSYGDARPWWSWYRYVGPHLVIAVASNQDGSIVSVVTDDATIFLLRGRDGEILTSWKLCQVRGTLVVKLSWFQSNDSKDRLLVEVKFMSSDGFSVKHSEYTVVTNIKSDPFDNDNLSIVADGARAILIQNIEAKCWDAAIGIVGIETQDDNILQFLSCDSDGFVSTNNYNIARNVFLETGQCFRLFRSTEDFKIDYFFGFQYTRIEEQPHYISVVSCATDDCSVLLLANPLSLDQLCHYKIQKPRDIETTLTVATVEEVKPFSSSSTYAVAIACKYTSKQAGGKIVLLQIIKTYKNGVIQLTKPHIIYSIPLEQPFLSICLAANANHMFGFRMKLQMTNFVDNEYSVFCPDEVSGSLIGRIRLCIQSSQFDMAEKLVSSSGTEMLTIEKYARFNPSEVALARIQHAFTLGLNNVIDLTQVCLRELAIGTLSSDLQGIKYYLTAVDFIFQSRGSLALTQYLNCLEIVAVSIANVQVSAGHEHKSLLGKINHITEGKIEALKFLHSVNLEWEDLEGIDLNSFDSAQKLFCLLVDQGKFKLARKLFTSPCGQEFDVTDLINPFLQIDESAKSIHFLPFLKEIILSKLTINHSLFHRLQLWCVNLVDAMDDSPTSPADLSLALSLLQDMLQITIELQLKVHSSFSYFSPFSDNAVVSCLSPTLYNYDKTPLSENSLDSHTVSARLHAVRQSRFVCERNLVVPTILELSALQVGAAKVVTRAGVSCDESFVDDDLSNVVNSKLNAARCLAYSRAHGLDRTLVSLRTFDQFGGYNHVAKLLAKAISASACSHEVRKQLFLKIFNGFCDRFPVDHDQILLSHVLELCSCINVSDAFLQEAASVADLCFESKNSSHAALAVIRAASCCEYSQSDIKALAKKAEEWAHNDTCLRSEIQEASRLLEIKSLVVKYCGVEALDLFRVDNPQHAMFLLEFVTIHVDRETVLSDAFSLCSAFHHLSRSEAASMILQNSLLHDEHNGIQNLYETLLKDDIQFAANCLESLVSFANQIIEECVSSLSWSSDLAEIRFRKERARCVTRRITNLLALSVKMCDALVSDPCLAVSGFTSYYSSMKRLQTDFSRIERLQNEHNNYVSLQHLHHTPTHMRSTIKITKAEKIREGNKSLWVALDNTKRVCSLLDATWGMDLWTAIATHEVLKHGTVKLEDLKFLLSSVGMNRRGGKAPSNLEIFLVVFYSAFPPQGDSGYEDVNVYDSLGSKVLLSTLSILQDCALPSIRKRVLDVVVNLAASFDVAYTVLRQSDAGVGEKIEGARFELLRHAWSQALPQFSVHETRALVKGLPQQKLTIHVTWHIGDGLLIPSDSTYKFTTKCYGNGIISYQELTDLFHVLDEIGCHLLALKVAVVAIATQGPCGCNQDSLNLAKDAFSNEVQILATRFLGGSGSGMTCFKMDSQLSVSLLVYASQQYAIKLYRKSIPAAIKTQNFERLMTLGNIGRVLVAYLDPSPGVLNDPNKIVLGWKLQSTFQQQCMTLFVNARWWSFLRCQSSTFVQRHLSQSFAAKSKHYHLPYFSTMLSSMTFHQNEEKILWLCNAFADAFEISSDGIFEFYLLHLVESQRSCDINKIRCSSVDHGLLSWEKQIRFALFNIAPVQRRLTAIMEVLVQCETPEFPFAKEYEKLFVILTVCREVMESISEMESSSGHDTSLIETQMEAVCRRHDAVALLLSVFNKKCTVERPSIASFFLPFDLKESRLVSFCDIIGSDVANDGKFDPLTGLNELFDAINDNAFVTALAPLCQPLGIPSGYIHARFLVAKFQRSSKGSGCFPEFDADVLPTLNRIKSLQDKVILGEWCSNHYIDMDKEKSKCLDYVLRVAMQCSAEFEHRSAAISTVTDHFVDRLPSDLLDLIKRLNSVRSSLNDKLIVNEALSSLNEHQDNLIHKITTVLCSEVNQCGKKSYLSPETLIDFLYYRGSFLAAKATIDSLDSFSMERFRSFAVSVHRACKNIAEQHSHINCPRRIMHFAHRWLLFGDDEPLAVDFKLHADQDNKIFANMKVVPDCHPVGLSLDLGNMEGRALWKAGCKLTPDESSLWKNVCTRELSERSHHRSSLRVAFVLAYANYGSPEEKENNKSNPNIPTDSRYIQKGHKQFNSSKKQILRDSWLYKIARQLLSIVFSQKETAIGSSSTMDFQGMCAGSTITFAMRHRALRAVALLCPQDALIRVAREEGYLSRAGTDKTLTLQQCTFGVFVAKEIEEIGLPQPHSDIQLLYTIDFQSYAHSLWRHFHDSTEIVSNGRLMLLLIEMSLHNNHTDINFVYQVTESMTRNGLFRSLLLAWEHMMTIVTMQTTCISINALVSCVHRIWTFLVERISWELQQSAGVDENLDWRKLADTFLRLSKIKSLPLPDNCDNGIHIRFIDDVYSVCNTSIVDKKNRIREIVVLYNEERIGL